MVLQALETVILVERFSYFLDVMSMSLGRPRLSVPTRTPRCFVIVRRPSVSSTMQAWPFGSVIIVRRALDR
jgi:hypothetical protein